MSAGELQHLLFVMELVSVFLAALNPPISIQSIVFGKNDPDHLKTCEQFYVDFCAVKQYWHFAMI